jgi:hypothetical protein
LYGGGNPILESNVKELMIVAGVCAALGLGSLAGAGYGLLGGKDVAIERIFAVIVWGLIGMALLGAAQWIFGMAMRMAGKSGRPSTDEPSEPRPI